MGVYPFMFGTVKDFEPVAEAIIAVSTTTPYPQRACTDLRQERSERTYDWDEYAPMYFPKAEELTKIAEDAEKNGEKEKASEYYLYGVHLLRRCDRH